MLNINSKKIILAIGFISFVLLECASQIKNTDIESIDSICNKLYKEQKLDSLVNFAHKTSIQYYIKKDFNNAIKFANKEIVIGLKVMDSTTYKNAIFNLGLFYYRNGNYYRSISAHQKVIDSFNFDKKTLIQ